MTSKPITIGQWQTGMTRMLPEGRVSSTEWTRARASLRTTAGLEASQRAELVWHRGSVVNRMTELERIEALEKDMLAPKDVAKCLGCTPYLINVATRDGKNPFPFPVIRLNSRVRIPKIPFVKAMRGELPTMERSVKDE